MKFIHLSDLHIGKRVNEFSMLEDQRYILTKIIDIIDEEKPHGVIIAGDVYDKSVPTAEAVELFDDFLVRLSERKLSVFVISGNHDSPERIAFGGRLMTAGGIYMSPVYKGTVQPVSLTDEYGTVSVYMLPFIKPANVRRFYPDENIETYTDAIRTAIDYMNIDSSRRNVLVTHQFVTGAMRSDSEDISVGGSDNVDASVFADFDYTALGHIHRPQNIGSQCIRYCGTPLKYSFSECSGKKSVTIAELSEKGSLSVREIPLVPKCDMAELRGTYNELVLKDFYENADCRSSYLHITLTDEEDIPDAVGKLRVIYNNLMKLDYDNTRTRQNTAVDCTDYAKSKPPLELFSDLYELQNNQPMTEEQTEFMRRMIEAVWDGKEQ